MSCKYMPYGINNRVGRIAHLFFNLGWATNTIAEHMKEPESEIYNALEGVHALRKALKAAARVPA